MRSGDFWLLPRLPARQFHTSNHEHGQPGKFVRGRLRAIAGNRPVGSIRGQWCPRPARPATGCEDQDTPASTHSDEHEQPGQSVRRRVPSVAGERSVGSIQGHGCPCLAQPASGCESQHSRASTRSSTVRINGPMRPSRTLATNCRPARARWGIHRQHLGHFTPALAAASGSMALRASATEDITSGFSSSTHLTNEGTALCAAGPDILKASAAI